MIKTKDGEISIKLTLRTSQKYINLDIVLRAFIQSCLDVDASILEPYIKEDQYFQDLDKYRFLQSLKEEFERVKKLGVERTRLFKGVCGGCCKGEEVYQFYGEKNCPEFAYVIRRNKEAIQDIFRCYLSSGMN